MPSLNFRAEFADAVKNGKKRQTIRKVWKRPIQAGDDLYLYTGLRTKAAHRLRIVICESVKPIRIEPMMVEIDGRKLGWGEMFRLAWADGFERLGDFFLFFERQYGLPFSGVLIKW